MVPVRIVRPISISRQQDSDPGQDRICYAIMQRRIQDKNWPGLKRQHRAWSYHAHLWPRPIFRHIRIETTVDIRYLDCLPSRMIFHFPSFWYRAYYSDTESGYLELRLCRTNFHVQCKFEIAGVKWCILRLKQRDGTRTWKNYHFCCQGLMAK